MSTWWKLDLDSREEGGKSGGLRKVREKEEKRFLERGFLYTAC